MLLQMAWGPFNLLVLTFISIFSIPAAVLPWLL
jgi:hypothetical protein